MAARLAQTDTKDTHLGRGTPESEGDVPCALVANDDIALGERLAGLGRDGHAVVHLLDDAKDIYGGKKAVGKR